MKALVLACLTVSLMVSPAHAQPLYTCGQGAVLSVQLVTEITTTKTYGALPGDEEGGFVELGSDEKKDSFYLVTVELGGTAYTGKARSDASGNFDPRSLGNGEPIAACINDMQMVLDRLDGTDFRAKVVRIEHRLLLVIY
jgi:hypothetical protein